MVEVEVVVEADVEGGLEVEVGLEVGLGVVLSNTRIGNAAGAVILPNAKAPTHKGTTASELTSEAACTTRPPAQGVPSTDASASP